jgi:hypothetical protein
MSTRHGRDCPKVQHVGGGYLHDADDDGSYDVDGVSYCGRCHGWMGSEISTPAPLPASDSPVLDLELIKKRLTINRGYYTCAPQIRTDLFALLVEVERLWALHASTEGALQEASAALDELAAPDPGKSLAQRIRDEFADFQMVIGHCSEVYDHFSRGRISKPNTLPSEVISIANDVESEDIEEAIKEAREEWGAEREATEGALRQVVDRWKQQAVEARHEAGRTIYGDTHRAVLKDSSDLLQKCADELSALLALPLGGERKT